MTKELVDELSANKDKILQHNQFIENLEKRNAEIRRNCDHYNPDGTSSCEPSFLWDYCKLCGETF
jgi:hypothetical protein